MDDRERLLDELGRVFAWAAVDAFLAAQDPQTMKASPGKDWPSDQQTAKQDQQRAHYIPIPDHAHSRA